MKLPFPAFIKFVTLGTVWKTDVHTATNPDGTVIYSREAMHMRYLSEALNFRFKIEYSIDGSVGTDSGNGNWSGMMGMLQRGESDLGLILLGMSEERLRVVNFSYPYFLADVNFLTNQLEPLPKKYAVFYPFSNEVWFFMFFLLLMTSLTFHLYHTEKSYLYWLITTFGTIFRQSVDVRLRSFGDKLAYLAWDVGMMILCLSYSAILLSYMSFPPLEGVRTITELSSEVAKGAYVCITYKNSYVIDAFLKSSEDSIKVIGRSLAENSWSYSNADAVLARATRRTAFIETRPFLTPYQRRFFLSSESFFTKMFGVAIRPGFCCRPALDRAIRKIFEAGLYEKIYRDRDAKAFIEEKHESPDLEHPLNLDDMIGAFSLLLLGYFIATITFVLELAMVKLQNLKILKLW